MVQGVPATLAATGKMERSLGQPSTRYYCAPQGRVAAAWEVGSRTHTRGASRRRWIGPRGDGRYGHFPSYATNHKNLSASGLEGRLGPYRLLPRTIPATT